MSASGSTGRSIWVLLSGLRTNYCVSAHGGIGQPTGPSMGDKVPQHLEWGAYPTGEGSISFKGSGPITLVAYNPA